MPQSGPPSGHVRVRLSHRPWEEADVPEDELPVLRAQGLLLEDDPDATAGSAAVGAGKATAGKAGAGKDQV